VIARFALVLGCLALAACASLPPSGANGGTARTTQWPAERQIVVTVRDDGAAGMEGVGSSGMRYGALGRYQASPAALRDADIIARRHRLQQLAAWPIGVLGVHCIVYGVDDARGLDAVMSEVAADRDVESVQPLGTFRVQSGPTYDDPYFAQQDGLAAMQVTEAHGWSRGSGVRVAVVDSGIDASHPDLAHRIVFQRDVTGLAATSGAIERHGTAVAGVIAADAGNGLGIVGVAPQAKVIALRACWQSASAGDEPATCNTLTLAQALSLAISERADVINLSLAGPPDPLLERLLKRALSMGKIIVTAVPETGAARQGFPANLPGVLAVASAEVARTPALPSATLFAPGRNVLTLRPGARYDFENGSSMAAASVSGIVALLVAERPRLTGGELIEVLHAAAVEPTATRPSAAAAPLVNACRAVVAVRGGGDCGGIRNTRAVRR
jgi:subtilisin family serine protease